MIITRRIEIYLVEKESWKFMRDINYQVWKAANRIVSEQFFNDRAIERCKIISLIALLIFSGCSVSEPIQKVWPDRYKGSNKLIDLSKLSGNVIDLKEAIGTVRFKGDYCGPRLIVKGASNIVITTSGPVKIANDGLIPEKPEAIVLDNPRKVTVRNEGPWKFELNGIFQVWGSANQLNIKGLDITNAHTGIRIASVEDGGNYKLIKVIGCRISNIEHEGIYIGPHTTGGEWPEVSGVLIDGNIIERCGWDGIQLGNTKNFEIKRNSVSACGLRDTYGQDFSLTVNPGSLGHIRNNRILGKIQILESKVFIE